MDKELTVKSSITINATAAKVWDALTNPEQTKKYMFGCETVSDWKAGSPLLWQANYEGKDTVFVKGNIVRIEPEKFLAYTTFDPNSTIEDIPANYLTVTYDLSAKDGQTLLTVTQGDYSKVADSERRYTEAYNGGEGWNPILVEIRDSQMGMIMDVKQHDIADHVAGDQSQAIKNDGRCLKRISTQQRSWKRNKTDTQ